MSDWIDSRYFRTQAALLIHKCSLGFIEDVVER